MQCRVLTKQRDHLGKAGWGLRSCLAMQGTAVTQQTLNHTQEQCAYKYSSCISSDALQKSPVSGLLRA